MVVSDKIQEAKDCFKEIRESGRNNYQKFSYLEAKDIFPVVRHICKQFKMKTQFDTDYDNLRMTLVVTDQEDSSTECFTIRIPELNTQDPGKFMQDEGRIRTYAMRYLYIQCFEIAVPDMIDDKDTKTPYKTKTKAKNYGAKASPVKPIREETSGELTAERIQDIIKQAEKEHTQQQLKKLTKDREPFKWNNAKDIIRKHCKNDAEYNACSQSIRFKTADKM